MRPLGVILAGGRGRRMGGADKAMVPLAGQPLLAHVQSRLEPQVAALVVNANGPSERFAAFGLPVVADAPPGDCGPLAGILAGLDAAIARGHDAIVTAAVDTPFLPADLVTRLSSAARSGVAVAASGGRMHYAFGLWPVHLATDLRTALAAGERRLGAWVMRHDPGVALFGDTPEDPFLNLNTSADLAAAEARLAATGAR